MKNMSISLRSGLSLAFIALTIVASLGVGTSAYYLSQKTMRENLRDRIKNISNTAASVIDADAHDRIHGEGAENLEEYKNIRQILQKIRNANPDLRFVYTMIKENGKYYFVVDAESDPEKMSHVGDEYTEITKSLADAFLQNGQVIVEDEFAKDQWGTWLSAFAPIRDSSGKQHGIVGVDIAAEKVLAYERHLRNLIFFGCFVTFLVSLVIAYFMAAKISKSLTWLVNEVSKVQQLDLSDSERIKTSIRELSDIGGAVEAMKSGLRSFKKYVPSDVVMDLLKLRKEANLTTEKRQLSIFFSDIADFTTISEQLKSEDLSQNLGLYLGRLSAIVKKYNGTVDKFIGDAIMAFWGAPLELKEHALNACLCALSCQREIREMNNGFVAKGFPPFHTRIGINSGEVIVGNIGHEERLNYTAIGDAVNLASRIEAVNKLFGTEILISADTYALVKDHFEVRTVNSVIVKGKTQPMVIYELLGEKGSLSEDEKHYYANYNRSMDLVFAEKYSEAILGFKEILLQRPLDPWTQRMLKEIAEMQNLPADEGHRRHLVLREK